MGKDAEYRFAVGAGQLLVTLALTALGLYLLLTGKLSADRIGAILFTSLIFGIVIWETPHKWRYSRYWGVVLACLAVHILLVGIFRSYLRQLPTMALGGIGTFECVGILWILLEVGE
jgi:hypothetical protein